MKRLGIVPENISFQRTRKMDYDIWMNRDLNKEELNLL